MDTGRFLFQEVENVSVTFTMVNRPSGHVAQFLRPAVQQNLLPKVQRSTAAIRAAAPRRTNRLVNSIRMDARDAQGRFSKQDSRNPLIAAYEISVNVPYASFVVRGTRPHIIRSRGDWPLRNRETGQVFGPVVRHPGTKPNNFIERGLRQGGF